MKRGALMHRKELWGSLVIVLLGFLGLFLSGFFQEPKPTSVTVVAIVGTFIISMIFWLPTLYFTKKYQKRGRTDPE